MSPEAAAQLDQLAGLLREIPRERIDLLLRPSKRLTVYLTPIQLDAVQRAADLYGIKTFSAFAARVLEEVARIAIQRKEAEGFGTDDGARGPRGRKRRGEG